RLHAAGLVRKFAAGQALALPGGLTCRSIPVPHDCDPTFAFRIDGPVGLFGPQWSVGYAADLGVAPPELIEAFADVNVLAIEFNHCEQMEQASGRPWFLIRRVLGDRGHLSNCQAADVGRAVERPSAPRPMRERAT